VLVTGGSSGLGLAIAERLAADGATVTICARTESRLREALARLETVAAPGSTCRSVVADVTDEARVAATVAAAVEPTGRLDAAVACAGGAGFLGPVTQLDAAAWKATLDEHLTGTMLTLKHAARELVRAGGGSFVGVSSSAVSGTTRWAAPYSVAKAGVEKLCRIAADELGASNVRVNCIRPGMIRTGFNEEISPERLADVHDNTALERDGEVDDVASLVRFLVGGESSWITGQVIDVDGGRCLRRGPDLRSLVEPVYGADALRGVVSDSQVGHERAH